MRVLHINICCGRLSTGKIVSDISAALICNGDESIVAYGGTYKDTGIPTIKIGNKANLYFHAIETRVFDSAGRGSRLATRRFLLWVKSYRPDIVHLHNIHGYYINIQYLFEYLKESNIPVVWTLHDCWSFTGHCAYFERINCTKWQNQCNKCPQKNEWPQSYFIDNSRNNYIWKKDLFSQMTNLTIVTPSDWLMHLVDLSFLAGRNKLVIKNGVDTNVFKNVKSNLNDNYILENKRIVLGVASPWSERKGLKDFIRLSQMLPKEYQIVLVGVDEKQIKQLPSNILGVRKTDTQEELVKLYNAAECFVNPTYEENYPTTNLEAYACGTPIITYATGGSVETANQNCIADKGDVASLAKIITSGTAILKPGLDVSKDTMIKKYLQLYSSIIAE